MRPDTWYQPCERPRSPPPSPVCREKGRRRALRGPRVTWQTHPAVSVDVAWAGQATGRVPEGGASPLEASHEQTTRRLCPEKPGGRCPRAMGASQPASLQRRLCRTSVSGHRGPGGKSRSGLHRTWFGCRATPAVGPEHPWGPLSPRRSLSKRGTIPALFHSPGSEPARCWTRLRPLPRASHQETLNHTGSGTAAARDILKETDYLHFVL